MDAPAALVHLKAEIGSARDFRAEILQLAVRARSPEIPRATLFLMGARLTRARLESEWAEALTAIDPAIGGRLELVVLLHGEAPLLIPENEHTRGVARNASAVAARTASRIDRSSEVLKVLLQRWLLNLDPIPVHELQAQTGLTYPTVSKYLAALGDVVVRESNRSVSLKSFPRQAWSELLALAPRIRQTTMFTDTSGRPPDLKHIATRLGRLHPEGVAVAGVLGARHRYPGFDLTGLPRIDLSIHAPDGPMNLAFIERLDPALGRTAKSHEAHVVAHVVPRASFLAEEDPQTGAAGMRWADPVEILLDLHELRLLPQADAFIRHLRGAS